MLLLMKPSSASTVDSRQSLQNASQHLKVLRGAGLVESRRKGREVRYTVRPDRLTATARQLDAMAGEWDARLAAIKRLAEAGD